MALLFLSLRAWAVAETLAEEEEEEEVCCVVAGMAEVGKEKNRDWIIMYRDLSFWCFFAGWKPGRV